MGREGWLSRIRTTLRARIAKLSGFATPDRLLATAIDECGYCRVSHDRARANLDKFLAYVRGEHANRPRPLAELLDDLESLRAMQSEAEAPPARAGDIVRLMSIHAAKGLEFRWSSSARCSTGRTGTTGDRVLFGARVGREVAASGHGQGRLRQRARDDLGGNQSVRRGRREPAAVRGDDARARSAVSQLCRAPSASAWQNLARNFRPASDRRRSCAGSATWPPFARARPSRASYCSIRPPVTGQHDSRAAATAIATFHACPRKYLLSSVDVQIGKRKSTARRIWRRRRWGWRCIAYWRGAKGDRRNRSELAGRFHGSELGRRAARADAHGTRIRFSVAVEDMMLRGQIDLWFEESGELILVDYKTDRDESSSRGVRAAVTVVCAGA